MILRFVGFEAFLIVRVVLWLNHVKPGPRKKNGPRKKKDPVLGLKTFMNIFFLMLLINI